MERNDERSLDRVQPHISIRYAGEEEVLKNSEEDHRYALEKSAFH